MTAPFKIATTLAALTCGLFFTPHLASAEKVGCPPREMLLSSIRDSGMVSVWRAWSDRGHVTEIFMKMDGEDARWLAVVHMPNNHSCVVDQGIKGKFMLQGKQAI